MSRIVSVNVEHPDESVIAEASSVILEGGVIVYPTETLYGIGADATNATTIQRVQRAKGRQENKPILVIVGSVEMLMPLACEITPFAKMLMKTFWPGPLTMVFRASANVCHDLTLDTGTIGIRIPSSSFCLSLLARTNVPLTSTSANRSGKQTPRQIDLIEKELKDVDLFLDAGELPESKPSTVLDVSTSIPRILRQGAISFEQLRTFVPDIPQPDIVI
jgi:L-threonylcarbamoyladenylate synthase